MTKTISKRNGSKFIRFFIIPLGIIVAIIVLFSALVIGSLPRVTTTTLTEERYNEGKNTLSNDNESVNINNFYLYSAKELCSSAIVEKTGEKIIDDYIRLWSDNGLLTFSYVYHSNKGFFSVPSTGDDNNLACLIDSPLLISQSSKSPSKNPFDIPYDIQYNGNTLKVIELN